MFELTLKGAAQYAVDEIASSLGCTKTRAMELFKNAIVYNCVIDEIVGQAMFLAEREEEVE